MKGKAVEFKVIKGILFKRCPKCRGFVEMTKFHRKHENPHNKQSYCKKCNAIYQHDWYQQKNTR